MLLRIFMPDLFTFHEGLDRKFSKIQIRRSFMYDEHNSNVSSGYAWFFCVSCVSCFVPPLLFLLLRQIWFVLDPNVSFVHFLQISIQRTHVHVNIFYSLKQCIFRNTVNLAYVELTIHKSNNHLIRRAIQVPFLCFLLFFNPHWSKFVKVEAVSSVPKNSTKARLTVII